MGKTHTKEETKYEGMTPEEKLKAFMERSDNELEQGTSVYRKFSEPGETLNGIFNGTKMVAFDNAKFPGAETECVIITDIEGNNNLCAQTIIVKELKKKWDETGQIGFPVRIKFVGMVGEGADKYQNFRIMF